MTVLKDKVRQLRPLYTGVDPADRLLHRPGEATQLDLWFPPNADPGGVWAVVDLAGAGHDDDVLTVLVGGDGPLPAVRGPAGGHVAADPGHRVGAQVVGLGPGSSDRSEA